MRPLTAFPSWLRFKGRESGGGDVGVSFLSPVLRYPPNPQFVGLRERLPISHSNPDKCLFQFNKRTLSGTVTGGGYTRMHSTQPLSTSEGEPVTRSTGRSTEPSLLLLLLHVPSCPAGLPTCVATACLNGPKQPPLPLRCFCLLFTALPFNLASDLHAK